MKDLEKLRETQAAVPNCKIYLSEDLKTRILKYNYDRFSIIIVIFLVTSYENLPWPVMKLMSSSNIRTFLWLK